MSEDKKDVVYAKINSGGDMSIGWGIKDWGFGEAYFNHNKESDTLMISSEYMNKESIKAIMNKLIDAAVFTDFETLVPTQKEISLEELNSLEIAGRKNSMVLNVPYHITHANNQLGDTLSLYWRIANENQKTICVVTIKNNWQSSDSEIEYAINVQENGFGSEFISAKLTTFEKVQKQTTE